MPESRSAHATMFGFDFQVNAAIVLMIENIKELNSLRLEGNNEDIELELDNNQYILAQAKAVEKSSSDFRNVRKNLQKALISLSEGNQKCHTRQLILITNSPNPLREEASRNIFLGHAHREFSSLPESSKKIIENYIQDIECPLELNKFMIQVLPFETDNDAERYKFVKGIVDDFIGDIKSRNAVTEKELLTVWHESVFKNGTRKDTSITLSKKDLIWPIMVIATDIKSCDSEFIDQFDPGLYDEIVDQYENIIDSSCERYEFFIKVLYDYRVYQTSKKQSKRAYEFAINKWRDYVKEFGLDGVDEEIQEGLIKIILYRIVHNRIVIKNIKEGVGL